MKDTGFINLSESPCSLYSQQGMHWLLGVLRMLDGSRQIVIHADKACGDNTLAWVQWLDSSADRHSLQKELGVFRGELKSFFKKHPAVAFVEASVTGSFFDLLLFAEVIIVKSRNLTLGFPSAEVGTFPALGGLESNAKKKIREVDWELQPTTEELVQKKAVVHNPFADIHWDFGAFIPRGELRHKKPWFKAGFMRPRSSSLPSELGSTSLWSHKAAIFRKSGFSAVNEEHGVYAKLLASQFFQSKYRSFLSRSLAQNIEFGEKAPASIQVCVESAAIPSRFLRLFFESAMCRQIYFYAGDMQTLKDNIYFLRERFAGKESGGGSLWEQKASFFVSDKANESIPDFAWNSSGHFLVSAGGEYVRFYHLDPAGSLVEIIDSSANPEKVFELLRTIGIQSVEVPKLVEGLPLTVLSQSAVFQTLSDLSAETSLPFSFFCNQLKLRGWELAGSLRQWSTFLNRRFLYFSHFRDHPDLSQFGLDRGLFEKDYADNLRLKAIGHDEALRWNPYRVETRVIKDLRGIAGQMDNSPRNLGLLSVAAGIPLQSGRLLHDVW